MKLEIHKIVAYQDLHWDCIYERLLARTKTSGLAQEKLVDQFLHKFFRGIRAAWVARADLGQGDNLVAAAICECHGCDQITIERNFRLSLGLLSLPVSQALKFKTISANTIEGSHEMTRVVAHLESGLVRIGPKYFSVNIRSYNKLFLFSTVCILIVSVFYALATLLIIYGLAIFIQFLADPTGITLIATKRADVGIALLSFLVGVAVLLRGSIKSIYRWIMRKKDNS